MKTSAKRVILFVCSGNVCRSPMAEYLLRRRLGKDSPWQVCSAGVSAMPGLSASEQARRAIEEEGIDMSGHRSRPVDAGLVRQADIIVVMTQSHRDELARLFPSAREKLFTLRSFDRSGDSGNSGDIKDPMGFPSERYRKVREEIEGLLPDLMEFMFRLE